jgi:hypothetical protein
MPMGVTTTAGGTSYTSAFVGRPGPTAHLKIDVSGLTTNEVDARGHLKRHVPFNNSAPATRIGSETVAGTTAAVADAGNTGNGTLTVDATTPVLTGAQSGAYRAVCILAAANGGTFAVFDPAGVEIGRVAVGATFANQIKFVINDGATDFAVGDAFTITATLTGGGAASLLGYGVTVEEVDLRLAVVPPTNTTLASETGDCFVAVATSGLLNRDIVEDDLGRALTAAEIAGLTTLPGSRFQLTST